MDSVLPPSRILDEAQRLAVDVLVVTDHNTIRGSMEVRRLAAGKRILVPIAAEYQTEKGDIIGVFLREEIRLGSAAEIIGQIRAQGGLVILPHPYKAHRLDDQLLAEMDLVEIHNSRCSAADNAAAKALAQKLERPVVGGADAHCAGELGAVMNIFSGELPANEDELRRNFLNSAREIESVAVSGKFRPYSQMIKAVKTRNPVLFLSQSKRLALTCLRESWRMAR